MYCNKDITSILYTCIYLQFLFRNSKISRKIWIWYRTSQQNESRVETGGMQGLLIYTINVSYCTLHVHVVVNIIWLWVVYSSGSKSVQICFSFSNLYCCWRSKFCNPINQFNTATFLSLVYLSRSWQVIDSVTLK